MDVVDKAVQAGAVGGAPSAEWVGDTIVEE
jgi:hypothetical protein